MKTESQKTIVSVKLTCTKCRQKVMMLVAQIEGIASIVLDPSKNTVTIIGEADPVRIIKKIRKFRRCAAIVSVGPAKEEKQPKKDEKTNKDEPPKINSVCYAPQTCGRCDVWYAVGYDHYSSCCIL